jgi:hypothetical protein
LRSLPQPAGVSGCRPYQRFSASSSDTRNNRASHRFAFIAHSDSSFLPIEQRSNLLNTQKWPFLALTKLHEARELPAASDALTELLESPVQTLNPNLLTNVRASAVFTPDGQALAYGVTGNNNEDNLWVQPLDGKPGRNFAQILFGEAKKLLVARGHDESDVILPRDTSK